MSARKSSLGLVATPTIHQMEAVECGAASLAMVLAYYGRYIPLEQLRIDCGVSRDGSRADRIKAAAEYHGLICSGKRREIDELREQTPRPAILFWAFGHFVVFEGMKGKSFRINDPAQGRRLIDHDEFSKSFTGVVLEFEVGPEFEKSGAPTTLFSGFVGWIGRNWLAVGFAMICGILLAVPGLLIPGFTKTYIDEVLVSKQLDFSGPIVIAMLLTVIVQVCLLALQQYVLARLEVKLFLVHSIKMAEHMFRLPIEFFQQRYTGDLVSRFVSNQTIATNLSRGLTTGVINLVTALCYAVVLISFHFVVGIIAVAATVLLLSVLRYTNRKVIDSNNSLHQEIGRQYGMLMSMLQGITEIKATSRENDVFSTWAGYQAKSTNSQQKLSSITSWLDSLPIVVNGILVNVIVLTMGGYLVMTGSLTLGGLIAMQMIATLLISPVQQLVMLARTLQVTRADMVRVKDVLHYRVDPALTADRSDEASSTPVEKLAGEIEFRNVKFGYDRTAAPLIENLSFKVAAGGRVAIAGGTGSGKSTIGKLILGLYTPWEGEILIDGRPLQSIPNSTFTNSITGVSQDVVIFKGSLRENVTLWDQSIPDQDVIEALTDAACTELLTRAGGLEVQLAESGRNISGGQQQRVEIARSLVRKPSFVVLDQATAALDAETEAYVDCRIRARGCGTLVIAQRLSTLRDADEIIVLESGAIAERGRHDELLQQGGVYAHLMELA